MNFYPDYRMPEDYSPLESIRYDIPHHLDLYRKFWSPDSNVHDLFAGALHGRDHQYNSLGGRPVITTGLGGEIHSRSSLFFNGEGLGQNTAQGVDVHQLEDRVRDHANGGVASNFDRLPEVRKLQYSSMLLPVIDHLRKNSGQFTGDIDFGMYKAGAAIPSYTNDLIDEHRFLHPSGHKNYIGFPAFHPATFWLKEYSGNERNSWERNINDYRVLDPYKHVHESIHQMFKEHMGQNIHDHLLGMHQAFTSLWDKFDSGEYERHPDFWSGHAFSGRNTRESAWEQLQGQLPNLLDIRRMS